jgi:hypothetical protein
MEWHCSGKDILVVLSAWQLVSGMVKPIMHEVEDDLPYLGVGWITHIRERLRAMNGRIWIEQQWCPTLQRAHDEAIMILFMRIKGMTKGKLEKLNYVRLFLHVITIADLANEQGNIIPGHRFSGKWQANSSLEWPDIPTPPPHYFTMIRSMLRQAIGRNTDGHKRYNAITLRKKLGTWYQTERHINHEFVRTDTQIFQRQRSSYKVYTKATRTTFNYSHTTTLLPKHTIPTTIGTIDDSISTHIDYDIIFPPRKRPINNERREVSNKHPIAGSDGSVDIVTGANAAAYKVYTGKEMISGEIRCPDNEYITSYRSELHGEYLASKCIATNATDTMRQVCDNKRAVEAIKQITHNPTRMLDPEADLILAIKHQRDITPRPSEPEWVKGHTDNDTPYDQLPHENQVNVDVDHSSGNERRYGQVVQDEPYDGSSAMLILSGKWVTTDYKTQILNAITEPAHRKYFASKFKHPNSKAIYDDITWKHIGIAQRNLKHEINSRISKYMYDWLNTGKQKDLFEQDGICPCCGIGIETQLHMFQCHNPDIARARSKCLTTFIQHMQMKNVPPDIIAAIIEITSATFEQRTPNLDYTIPTSQQMIGYELLTRGFLTKQWLTAIMHFTQDKPEQKLKSILQGLWLHVMEPMWEARNNILHKDTSIVHTNAHKQLDSELKDWKILSQQRLHHTQQNLTSYSTSDFKRWTLQHKQNTLYILQLAHRNYKQYLESDQSKKLQKLITEYIPKA